MGEGATKLALIQCVDCFLAINCRGREDCQAGGGSLLQGRKNSHSSLYAKRPDPEEKRPLRIGCVQLQVLAIAAIHTQDCE